VITKEKGKELTEEIMKGMEEKKQESEEKKEDYRNS
jgi:polyhydroxyalkanoate synthesis regulator phasin